MGQPSREIAIFQEFIQRKGLKKSAKRDKVVSLFLKAKTHLSAEELYQRVKAQYRGIGFTTVYRTLKLMVESGLAEVVDFDDGVKRYERLLGRESHAHLICLYCGKNFEVFDKQLGQLAWQMAKRYRFLVRKHMFKIFGLCENCSLREAKKGSTTCLGK